MADGAWQMGMEMAKRQMATSIDKENLQTVCLTLHMMAGSAVLSGEGGEVSYEKPLGQIKYEHKFPQITAKCYQKASYDGW